MKTIKIPHRFTNEILFETKAENIKEVLEIAVKNKVNLENANLENADLEYANLENANLYNANLENANLENANLYKANLGNANLEYANLKYADLENANLDYANLDYANLDYANLYKANLKNAKGIIHIQFTGYDMWIQMEHTKIGCKSKTNKEWLNMSIEDAVKLRINKIHFEAYKMLGKTAIEALKTYTK